MQSDPILASAAADRFDEAVAAAQAEVAATPSSAAAYERLGAVLAFAQRYEEAARAFAAAIALNPQSAEAFNNFGAVLRAVGKVDEAQRYFERALDLNPAFHEALLNALGWYNKQNDHHGAHRRLTAAIDAGDKGAETYEQLGLTLYHLERLEESLAASQRAIELEPSRADAWANLSTARMELGDIAGAREAIEEAIRLAPNRPQYYLYLTAGVRAKDVDRYSPALEKLVTEPSLSPENRLEVHFALGDIAAANKQWEKAFGHYAEGNRIKRRLLPYDEAEHLGKFKNIANVFTQAFIENGSTGFDATERPIFIVGMPRSGTTLVEQILASHPAVFAAGELSYLEEIVQKVFAQPGPITGEVGVRYAKMIAELAPSTALRVTDKMPMNFEYVGLIRMVMPNARIIHTRRDPLDTCWSCFSTEFAAPLPWTYNLVEVGHYYRAYSELMDHWRSVLPQGTMLEIQYEELIADFETHARRIVDFCGLEWDERCLSFHQTERAVRTASAVQVRQPLYSKSIGRSRVYGELLRPLADAIGIDL